MEEKIEIFEFEGDNPYGLYVAGIDKYRSTNATSLEEEVRNILLSNIRVKKVIFCEMKDVYGNEEDAILIKLSNNFVGLSKSEITKIYKAMNSEEIVAKYKSKN